MRFRRVRCSAHLCSPGLLNPSGLGIPCCKPRAASVGINRPPTPTPFFRLFKLRTHHSCSVPNPHATAPVRCLPGAMTGRLACQLLAAGLLALATAVTAQPSPSDFDIREWTPVPRLLGVCCAFAIAAAGTAAGVLTRPCYCHACCAVNAHVVNDHTPRNVPENRYLGLKYNAAVQPTTTTQLFFDQAEPALVTGGHAPHAGWLAPAVALDLTTHRLRGCRRRPHYHKLHNAFTTPAPAADKRDERH